MWTGSFTYFGLGLGLRAVAQSLANLALDTMRPRPCAAEAGSAGDSIGAAANSSNFDFELGARREL